MTNITHTQPVLYLSFLHVPPPPAIGHMIVVYLPKTHA